MENSNPNPRSNPSMTGGLSTTISDLSDDQLIAIFVGLPLYEDVITCKLVSKHWLSLLSDPKFVIEFVNRKKEDNMKKPNPKPKSLPWTFFPLSSVKLTKPSADKKKAKSSLSSSFIKTHNKLFYKSPKFSLNFLVREVGGIFTIADTFKDLVLCLNVSKKDHRHYYICNPVTKRWVALPPTPSLPLNYDHSRYGNPAWSGLTCEDPFGNNNNNGNIDDYRFRVVVAMFPRWPLWHKRPRDNAFITLGVTVFCSDNRQWIDIDVRVPLNPNRTEGVQPLKGVICNGMVCLCYGLYFGMFNAFDVNANTHPGTVVEARGLPIPPMFCRSYLLECGGRLISVRPNILGRAYNRDKRGNLLQDHKAAIEVRVLYSELNLNQVVDDHYNEVDLRWKGLSHDIFVDKTGTLDSVLSGIRMINVHPRNSQLLYMFTSGSDLILCDRRSSSLKILGQCKSLPTQLWHAIHRRIELQYWPTPLPNISSRSDTS